MARAADQFRASDVTFWGIAALASGGLAVLSANVSALVPDSILVGLHASRLQGASITQLRAQVASLQEAAEQLKRDNNLLLLRFSMSEQAQGETARRIGALEVSLPNLLEQRTVDGVDPSTTASIATGAVTSYDADGGSVSVQQKPWVTTPGTEEQPMPALPIMEPAAPTSNADAYGIALGSAQSESEAAQDWADLNSKVGTLLLGLGPLLAGGEADGEMRVVAGPIPDFAQALALCRQMDKVAIPCVPVPFVGTPLPR